MASPTPSHNLKCHCGSAEFLKLTKFRWADGGGTVEEFGGWKCAQCLERADNAEMIQRARIEAKRAQIRELEGQVGGGKDASTEGRKV